MSWRLLCVGDFIIEHVDDPPPELLAVFQDSMCRTRPFHQQLDHPGLTPRVVKGKCKCGTKHPDVVHELAAAGPVIADRLDALGITCAAALEVVDRCLDATRAAGRGVDYYPQLADMDAQQWLAELVELLREESDADEGRDLYRLFLIFDEQPVHDLRFQIRLMLLADRQQQVVLDLTAKVAELGGTTPVRLCAEALSALHALPSANAPIVVLTEGSSDVAILEPALHLLYPHLIGLIRFMDFAERPAGGAGPLVGTVRAFAAAGISNRVVALFDNDSAAAAALGQIVFKPWSKKPPQPLPANIRVCQLPEMDHLRRYPTLGPPTIDNPEGRVTEADVNGTAASIELYFGEDVLTGAAGGRQPVQWRSFIKGPDRYQGEVTDKEHLHEMYQRKMRAARSDPATQASQDWTAIRAVLDILLHAFNQPVATNIAETASTRRRSHRRS